MKRPTVITPAAGIYTLPNQPFGRTLLLVNITGIVFAAAQIVIRAKIFDVSGNICWQYAKPAVLAAPTNFQLSVQGCETESFPSDTELSCPLPDDLTIPAGWLFTVTIEGWQAGDTTPNLVLTTDDPFLDGARPFDDLQAP